MRAISEVAWDITFETGDRVSVLGFPIGGERMSLTQGVVSRIEVTPYAQSERRLLAVQIDAAINEGNSGGPVLDGNSLVGIAFQALEQAESVGYMIPTPVVERSDQGVLGQVARLVQRDGAEGRCAVVAFDPTT